MKNRYPLPNLLWLLNMAKNSYYYHETAIKQPDKYSHIRKKIIELFNENRKCYGYRRIHQKLKRLGITISEKIVCDIRYSPLSKYKSSERLTDRVLSLSVILKIPDTCQLSYFLSMLKLMSRLRLSNAALHKSIGCMSNTGSDLFMIFTLSSGSSANTSPKVIGNPRSETNAARDFACSKVLNFSRKITLSGSL